MDCDLFHQGAYAHHHHHRHPHAQNNNNDDGSTPSSPEEDVQEVGGGVGVGGGGNSSSLVVVGGVAKLPFSRFTVNSILEFERQERPAPTEGQEGDHENNGGSSDQGMLVVSECNNNNGNGGRISSTSMVDCDKTPCFSHCSGGVDNDGDGEWEYTISNGR